MAKFDGDSVAAGHEEKQNTHRLKKDPDMKTVSQSLLALALGLSTFAVVAQDGQRPGRPEGRPHRGSPVIAALDVNQDRVLDASEMANASTVLAAFDKNGDGQLTVEELRPARPSNVEGGPAGPEGRPGGHPGGRPHGAPPMIQALDMNQDQVIDATEIANAPAALATLDTNKDGQLVEEELRPAPPADAKGEGKGGRGRGGRGGRGPGGQRPTPPAGE